jgi:O-antigen/teichoic acid export membrane protein
MFSVILIVFDGGFRAVMIGVAVESAIFAVAASLTAWSDLFAGYSLTILRGMLAFGLPLVPLAFGLTALSIGDRFILRQFSDLQEVGRYAVANKIAAGLNIFIRAFQVAWPAVLFSSAARPDAARFYARLLTYFVFMLAMAGLAVSLFARDLVALLAGESFGSAFSVVPILALAQIALGVFYVTAVGSNLTGKTHLQTTSVLFALGIFAAACYLLIPDYKMTGAAIASALGYAALTGMSCMLSLRVYPVRYEWGRIAVLLLIAVALSTIGSAVFTRSLLIDVIVKAAVIVLYPGVLFAVGFMDNSERRVLQSFYFALVRRVSLSPRTGAP